MNEAAATTIARFPILMDYYIKLRRKKRECKNVSKEVVLSVDEVFIRNVQTLIQILKVNTQFYDESAIGSYDASRARVMYLKDL